MPSNWIRLYKTRKETERRPQETKKTVYNKKKRRRGICEKEKKKINGMASARNENE